MLCSLFNSCIYKIKNVDQPGRDPVFKNIEGSTEGGPGQWGSIEYGQPTSNYEVFTVPSDKIFVLEHVSAAVTRGSTLPYPPENMNDYGAAGYELDENKFFHNVPFIRSEPGGVLMASFAVRINMPPNARVIVKVPIIPNQSGGADINVSGYYINA